MNQTTPNAKGTRRQVKNELLVCRSAPASFAHEKLMVLHDATIRALSHHLDVATNDLCFSNSIFGKTLGAL